MKLARAVITVLLPFTLVACSSEQESDESPAAAAVDVGVARVFDIPYLMQDLDNGLRVIIVRTDYPDIVTIQIPVQTGSRNEVEPGKSGFAHFFENSN